jgi:hypothetical protein
VPTLLFGKKIKNPMSTESNFYYSFFYHTNWEKLRPVGPEWFRMGPSYAGELLEHLDSSSNLRSHIWKWLALSILMHCTWNMGVSSNFFSGTLFWMLKEKAQASYFAMQASMHHLW